MSLACCAHWRAAGPKLDVQPSVQASTAGALQCLSIMPANNAPRERDSLLNGVVHDNYGIVHRLVNSSFGSFNKCLESIRCLIPEFHMALPRVVVVGSRDAGKSSLLENITKCSIFPRDKGLCTKMPIRFHLICSKYRRRSFAHAMLFTRAFAHL